MLAAGFAGCVSWLFAYPFDVIQTKIQVSPVPLTIRDALRSGLRLEGAHFLYKGLSATLLWTMLTSFLELPLFEQANRTLIN